MDFAGGVSRGKPFTVVTGAQQVYGLMGAWATHGDAFVSSHHDTSTWS